MVQNTNPTKQHLHEQLKQLKMKEDYQAKELEQTRALIAGHLRTIELIEEDEKRKQ